MRFKGRFLFLSITDENGQCKMVADEKSTLKLFFDCRFHSPHSGTNTKIKWDMCLCILNIILKYALVPAYGYTDNWHEIHISC